MGWGIYLYPEIYYSKVNFKCKEDVKDEIDNIKSIIKNLEQELYSLVITTEPEKMMGKNLIDEGYTPMDWLNNSFNNIVTNENSEATLKDYYYDLFKLEMLYDHWDYAHNKEGKAIRPPKDSFSGTRFAYMCGDFIDSVFENE